MPNRDKPLRRLWIAFRPPEEWWFWELEVGPADISRGLSCRNRTTRFADWACQANSDLTAMAGGTIVLGPLAASFGADYFTVQDLGVDAGQAYINANNGASPTDALLICNNGQVIGAPPVQSPLIENVSCLGYSSMAPVHCMLVRT
jgi:hypothetical protein